MTDTFRTIFCVLDGETRSNVFPVSISPTSTVGQLKKLLKAEKSNEFNNIDADKLTLWRVSIPNIDDNESPILLNNIADNEKRRIFPRSLLSDAFPEDIQQQMIHVIMQCPLQTQPDVLCFDTASHQELSELKADVNDPFINLGIIVHPEKNVSFSWTALLETVTLAGLRGHIFRMYPQYDHDDHLEISVYNGQPKPELICDDEELRKLLKITKITSKTKLTISLGTPTKTFSAWTFKDVCAEYDLTDATDPCIEDLPPFMDIQAATLDTEFQRNMCDELICEVEKRVNVLELFGANEATKSLVVAPFLIAATSLFKQDLYLASQRDLNGPRGNGPVDFSVHSQRTHAYTLGVTEVKRDDFRQGVAQNIVQLESALTAEKRKREVNDVDGEDEPPRKLKAYGIVTDSKEWAFIECTMNGDKNETVQCRISKLRESLNFEADWQDDAKIIFRKLVWLWSLMRDEIPKRESDSGVN